MIHHRHHLNKEITAQARQQLITHRPLFLALGVSLVSLGSLALCFSAMTTFISIVYIGIALVIVGIFELIQSIKLSHWTSFFMHLFLGILYTTGGGIIIAHPLVSEATITLLIAFFFMVSGILKTLFAITHPMINKGWRIFDGIITLLLGILIIQQWPNSGLWVIGMFVGINMLLTGWSLIIMSYSIK